MANIYNTCSCVSVFGVGGGYLDLQRNGANYAITAHLWGHGHSKTYFWKSHAVFIR